jgi:uncharacterized repeat protein (TIGR03803 family)
MRPKKSLCRNILAATAVVIVLSLLPSTCWAVTYRMLHQFTGADGAQPHSELIVDNAGNLYGTTVYGGNLFCTNVGLPNGCGVVFKLTRKTNGWSETILHSFSGGDGAYPVGGLVFDHAGNLYGTASSGGNLNCDAPHGCGTVFKLTPNSDGSWSETVLYSFSGEPDGFGPNATLVFDVAGNLYGTTASGGLFQGDGIVFELKPNSDGTWTEQILHRFVKSDGSNPAAKLTFDAAGNLYGTTTTGGPFGSGTVFKLAPNGDGNWTENVLHSFSVTDGSDPLGGVVFDSAGNLYGTTSMGGSIRDCSGRCGLVYKLSPNSDAS